MFHNYFFLKRLSQELEKKLNELCLLECFSQNKNELILGFGRKKTISFYIRAHLDPHISLLAFPEEFARAGKNSIDLFDDLIEKKVSSISVFQYERSFRIEMGEDALIFKMHAHQANILCSRKNKVINLFRKNLNADLDIIPSDLNKNIEITEDRFKENTNDPLQLIPALGKKVRNYLEKNDFYQTDSFKKWEFFQKLIDELNENPIYLHDEPSISLLEESSEKTDSAIVATNWLYDRTVGNFYLDKEKNQTISQLKQKIKKSENYISKTNIKLNQVENARNSEEIANILMANLNDLQTGLSKAVLHDFYKNESIEIQLNRKLSPQKNAENFYRKAKNRHQEINVIKENIKAKEKLTDKLSKEIVHIRKITDTKEWRNYLKDHGIPKKAKRREEPMPYHNFEVDGWQILLGKNAKSNDELTLKIAKKNDLWLHVKDVAGSHVIIRQKPGQNFPTILLKKRLLWQQQTPKEKRILSVLLFIPKRNL